MDEDSNLKKSKGGNREKKNYFVISNNLFGNCIGVRTCTPATGESEYRVLRYGYKSTYCNYMP